MYRIVLPRIYLRVHTCSIERGGETKVEHSEILKGEFISLLLLGHTVNLKHVFYDLLQLFVGQISEIFWAIKYSYRS